jgi:hypothetical protein
MEPQALALALAALALIVVVLVWGTSKGCHPPKKHHPAHKGAADGFAHRPPPLAPPRATPGAAHTPAPPTRADRLAAAEREQWGGDDGAHFAGGETFDHGGHIADLVVDDKARARHAEWVGEVRPHTGTALRGHKVDDLDEFSSVAVHWQGLRLPHAVYNQTSSGGPAQITEADSSHFEQNRKVRW